MMQVIFFILCKNLVFFLAVKVLLFNNYKQFSSDIHLAQVHQALRDAHEEQMKRIFCVISRQLSQHRRQPCVVGARADETEGEDCIESNVGVVIVAVFI